MIRIVSVEPKGEELQLQLEANFRPEFSRNHIHVWWDNYDVEQVSGNAETVHGVTQGSWHPTDEYPVYVTQSEAAVSQRDGSDTLCVSAADRNHDILDVSIFECVSVADHLE